MTTIGLLQCDHVSPQFREVAQGDYDDMFLALFREYAPHISLKVYDVLAGEYPASLGECEGYISTGSRDSVYDDTPWINQLCGFVRALYENEHKFVGICFGHQMIAHALGGKVEKSERGWGIGVKTVEMIETKPWMEPPLTHYNLILSHQDQVEKLPPGSTLLGGNAHCPNAIFSMGDHFLGIQAHPEFLPAYAEALMLYRIGRIEESVVRAAQQTLEMELHRGQIAGWIARFFAG